MTEREVNEFPLDSDGESLKRTTEFSFFLPVFDESFPCYRRLIDRIHGEVKVHSPAGLPHALILIA